MSGELIRLRNRSKLVEGSLFVLNDLLHEAKSIILYFIWRVSEWFSKKNFKKKIQIILLH